MSNPPPQPLPDLSPVVAFLDGGGFANAVREANFTQQELISRIITLSRDSDPKIALKGLTLFRQWLHDTLSSNGQIVRQSIHTMETPDGNRTLTHTSRTILPPSFPRTGSTLEDHHHLPALNPPSGSEADPAPGNGDDPEQDG